MTRFLIAAVAALLMIPSASAKRRFLGDQGRSTFATPNILKRKVALWRAVYGVYHRWQRIFYDSRYPDLILSTIDLRESKREGAPLIDRGRRSDKIQAEKERLERALRRLSSGKRRRLSKLERKLLRLYVRKNIRGAHRRVRSHFGLRGRFAEGLKRLARYRPYVEKVLRKHQLPTDLVALAMTESLFNPFARSHAGAYGVWQFLQGTGREFLHINKIIDERRDPIVSTDAAARMLRKNLKRLKYWPLAITGYNYGPYGMERAAKQVGSYHLTKVLRRFRSRRFGFAARNYYASFLAAREVLLHHKRYFPKLSLPPPLKLASVQLPGSARIKHVAKHCGISTRSLAKLNPGLTPAVKRSSLRLPQGFPLWVPRTSQRRCRRSFHRVAGVRRSLRRARRVRVHRVRRGESLTSIARRFGTSVSAIISLNRIRRRGLWVGERIRVPHRPRRFTLVRIPNLVGDG